MAYQLGPGAYVYRPLKRGISGWDVQSFQSGLAGIKGSGADPVADGVFGARTAAAVRHFQIERNLDPVDEIAGAQTQRKLAQVLGRKFRDGWQLPHGIPFGHIEHESSCLFGNHTPPYDDGERDCGLVQRNTNYATEAEAFDAPDSIHTLCEKVVNYKNKYDGPEYDLTDRRAWELACGSWNAPAWTDTLASGGSLAEAHRERIEDYIAAVTIYLDWS